MIDISKDQIDTLIQLQEVELEADAIERKLNAIPQKLDDLDVKLNNFTEMIKEKEAKLVELEKTYRTFEADAQMYLNKVEKSQEKLRSVKTNKEYQSSLKEIEELEKLHSQLEDKMLECLEESDQERGIVEENKEKLRVFSGHIKEEKEQIRNDSREIKNKLESLGKIKTQVAEKLTVELHQKYYLIKKIAGGIALAGVKKSVCQGCNVNIPPQMYNELQRLDKLLCCPHCERILFPISS